MDDFLVITLFISYSIAQLTIGPKPRPAAEAMKNYIHFQPGSKFYIGDSGFTLSYSTSPAIANQITIIPHFPTFPFKYFMGIVMPCRCWLAFRPLHAFIIEYGRPRVERMKLKRKSGTKQRWVGDEGVELSCSGNKLKTHCGVCVQPTAGLWFLGWHSFAYQ